MGMRIFPSVNEYLTIRKAVSRIMRPKSGQRERHSQRRSTRPPRSSTRSTRSPGRARTSCTLGDSGKFRTSFAYNVEIPIFEPVYILIKYSGSATSGGAKGP